MPSNENSPRIRERLFARHFAVVKRFDEMPDDALVSPAVIACMEDCSLPTFYRRVASGMLPAPRRVGGSSRVLVGDYRRIRAARAAIAPN
jgi:predicted DNA-binding transcriptional regulator AlpA